MLDELARLAAGRPAVVLDDDPTGTQTLRDVPVLTEWDQASIGRHLHEPAIFLSTNSRSLDQGSAVALITDAVRVATDAARIAQRRVSFVSRSDSTLRGHFPAETEAIAQAAGMADARFLLAPYFGEGGRVTVDGVHYLERDGGRVPVGETEFARDAVFGYRASDLRVWVAEKYAAAGRPVPLLAGLDLAVIRAGGTHAVADRLRRLPPGAIAIADAEHDADIETVGLGALLAEEDGLPLVARVAASYVRARAGRPRAPLLTAAEVGPTGPGLVLVGSHVETTTRQLERMRERLGKALAFQELSVAALLDDAVVGAVRAAARAADAALADGRTPVIFTQRRRAELDLAGGRSLSRALAEIVAGLERRPAWVLAKGGITSSDVARHGLVMREARVAGQLLPGVPVWLGTETSRWPGLPLVVFPGNVGGPNALAEAVASLTRDPG